MSETAFQLDPRLQADSAHVAQLPLCELRLMNDARFPWLLLIPRQHGLSELDQLNEQQHHLLWQDIRNASAVLRATSPCDKLNIGALGNI